MRQPFVNLGWLLVFLGCVLIHAPTWAQQTIFNVPSADITPAGRLFLQHEIQTKPWGQQSFATNTTYAAYGVGHYTELDLTVFNVSAPASDNISVGVGFKSAIPLLQKRLAARELKLTVGGELPIGLQGNGVGHWTYSHVSVRLPVTKTRLTGGVSYGTRQLFGRKAVAFIGGVEQPITQRVSLLADWYSGSHGLGLLTAGTCVALPHETNLYVGYQVPNTPRSGQHGAVIEVSKLLF